MLLFCGVHAMIVCPWLSLLFLAKQVLTVLVITCAYGVFCSTVEIFY